jgi:hypothetical protein
MIGPASRVFDSEGTANTVGNANRQCVIPDEQDMKRYVLRLFERAGYVVLKTSEYRALRQFRLEAERKHAEAAREFHAGRERDARQLAELQQRYDEAEAIFRSGREQLEELRERRIAAERKLIEADRNFRLGRERDAREVERARLETWEAREQIRALQERLLSVGQEPTPVA